MTEQVKQLNEAAVRTLIDWISARWTRRFGASRPSSVQLRVTKHSP